MISNGKMSGCKAAKPALILLSAVMFIGASATARATECMFELQGEGRVSAVIDGRTLRLDDGREVRLAGIEPASFANARRNETEALAALVTGRDVTLRADTDSPDRYGRQPAFVFLDQSDISLQGLLLQQGKALVSPSIADKSCAASLILAEASARAAKRGIWSDPAAIKSAESPATILNRVGQFTVVEGKVLSVREAGATTYINFGRRWTRDFAVTISRRMVPAFEAAGIAVKSLENRRIRVRGWVEARGGPRIEALQTGQIELLGAN